MNTPYRLRPGSDYLVDDTIEAATTTKREKSLLEDFDARFLLELLFRRKRLILLPFILTPVLAVAASYLMAPAYISTTTILLGKEDILNPLLRTETAVTMSDMNRLSSFQKIIYSRPLIEEAMESVGMKENIKSGHEMEEAVKRVRANIEIMGLQADSFQIGYTAPTPKLAKDMVETISRLFIEKSLKGSRRDAEAAVVFIQKAVDHYRKELNRTENELQKFRRDNAETLQQNRSLARQLQQYEASLLAARLDLQQEELRERLLSQQLAGEKRMIVQKAVYVTNTRYETQYRELALQRANLLATRNESHPEIKKIDREMGNVRQLMQKEKSQGSATETEEIRSPVYQALSARLEDTRIQKRVAQQKVKNYNDLVIQAKKDIRGIPLLEKKQTRMEGEVRLTREIYDNLRMKLEQALVARDIEVEQQASRYTIIDPPLVPLTRHRPKRMVFAAVGIIGGLCIGLSCAFFTEFTAPHLVRAGELSNHLKLPVLGILPKLSPPLPLRWLRDLLVGPLSPPRYELPSYCTRDLLLDHKQVEQAPTSPKAGSRHLDDYIDRLRYIGLALKSGGSLPDGGICMIASARDKEGKSLLAANLAVIQAVDLGKPVLLIDVNPKRSAVAERYVANDAPGLAEILTRVVPVDDAIYGTGNPNLSYIPAGNLPSHPTSMFNSNVFSQLLDIAREEYALTIIDAPNLLENAEGFLLASQVDAVLLVCRLFHTRKEAIDTALERLPANKLRGVVINGEKRWLPTWLDRLI